MDARVREELERVHARIADRFGRAETRERAMRYLLGLLEGGEGRRSGRRMAEKMGEGRPDGAQRLLNSARWDADLVRDDLRAYVVENLGDPGGLVLVEAGFPKKGAGSAGVTRQLDPSTGRVHNCQVGLFLAFASSRGRAVIDRELYLPEVWAEDAERRRAAGVPEEVRYAAKGELALRMLERALKAGVPAAWVSGGLPYEDDEDLRRWLRAEGHPFALVRRFRKPENAVGVPCRPPRRITKNVATWTPLQGGTGSWEGHRTYGWRYVSQDEEAADTQEEWLVLRRWTDASRRENAYYRAYRFGRAAPAELAAAAATHEAVEKDLERARGGVGLGEHEARRRDAWYRHGTLCLLAYAASQVAQAGGDRSRGDV